MGEAREPIPVGVSGGWIGGGGGERGLGGWGERGEVGRGLPTGCHGVGYCAFDEAVGVVVAEFVADGGCVGMGKCRL